MASSSAWGNTDKFHTAQGDDTGTPPGTPPASPLEDKGKAPVLRPAKWTRHESMEDLRGASAFSGMQIPGTRLFNIDQPPKPLNTPPKGAPKKPPKAPEEDDYEEYENTYVPRTRRGPRMPNRSDNNAPKFDGKPGSITPFLDEIENWGEVCSLTDAAKIRYTLQYIPTIKVQSLWKTRPAVKSGNWEQFKREIYELYPGAGEVSQFTLGSIKSLVEKQAKVPIKDRDDVGEYYRELVSIVDYLKANNLGSVDNPGDYFLQGLHPAFRRLVKGQLQRKDPDHELDAPWPLKDAYQAALKMSVSDEVKEVYTANAPSSSEKKPTSYDVSKLLEAMSSDDDNAANLLETLINKVVDKRGGGGKRPGSGTNKPRNTDCIFCSNSTHFHHDCPKVKEYMDKGLCKRNENNKLVLPDGRMVPRYTDGKNLMEKLDNWYKANPKPEKTVSANIQEVHAWNVTCQAAEEPLPCARIEEVVNEDPAGSTSAQGLTEVPFSEIEDLQVLEALAVQAQKKAEDQRSKLHSAHRKVADMRKEGKDEKRVDVPSHEKARSATVPPPASGPAEVKPVHTPIEVTLPKGFGKEPAPGMGRFKFVSAVEDPAAVGKIMDTSLDCEVTITLRNLLAVAPDIRRNFRDLVVAKRVPSGNPESANAVEVEALYNAIPPSLDDVIVSNHYEDLRAIDVLVNGQVPTEAVLDSGSQIVAISKQVWEKTGLPLQADRLVRLESANKSKNVSLGLLQNLPVVVGGVTFWVQAQVLEFASYEMLLGLPFMTLTRGTLQHYSDNEADLVLTDPNTGQRSVVPTRARVRQEKGVKGTNTLGIFEPDLVLDESDGAREVPSPNEVRLGPIRSDPYWSPK